MAGETNSRGQKGPSQPVFEVELEYDPGTDSEERLLQVYEFLLEETDPEKVLDK